MVPQQSKTRANWPMTMFLLRCAGCFAICAALVGCPGGGGGAPQSAVAETSSAHPGSAGAGTPINDIGSTTGGGVSSVGQGPTTAALPVGTDSQAVVTAVNLSGNSLHQVPVTFGEPFAAGAVPKGNTIVAYLDGTALPTQADIKARNPDGSVRHAIVTVELPSLAGKASTPLRLHAVAEGAHKDEALTLDDVLQSGFDATVDLNVDGQPWHLDAHDLLQHASLSRSCDSYGRECAEWLSGPLASEWIVGGPILDAHGKPNPHIAVYFAVRAYGPAPVSRVRVDVIVENDWAYAPGPQNVTYDAKVSVNGQPAYTMDHLEHYRQARWHKVFWWGKPDPVYARQDSQYLQSTRAVPRYEDIKISQGALQAATQHVQQSCGPMQHCDQSKNMENAGAQPAIGPLPRWTAAYVIDTSDQAYNWMLANSDALGSYGIHYRDQLTGDLLSVDAHPCATLVRAAEFSRCPVAPHANDSLPRCKDQCQSPLTPNISHHPAPAYVAYLVTGDWYYLDELKFWADWVEFWQNPKYRDYRTGLIHHNTLRAQAWSLRTLGYAAYILPDNDPFKGYFNRVVKNDIQWYNQNYTEDRSANKLHIITNGSIVYPNDGNALTGISTWQTAFFTWAVGNLEDLGFAGADKLLDWVGAFQVDLMTSPDYCWVVASGYELQVRDTKDSPFYDSLRTVYAKTYPGLQGVACGSSAMAAVLNKSGGYHYAPNVMVGHPESPVGFPANFQVGLAAAADSDAPDAANAWATFAKRSAQPNYSSSPQFDVVPRTTMENGSP
jgi:hypothetical protein